MREFPKATAFPIFGQDFLTNEVRPRAGVQYGADGGHNYCINAYSGGDLIIATDKWANNFRRYGFRLYLGRQKTKFRNFRITALDRRCDGMEWKSLNFPPYSFSAGWCGGSKKSSRGIVSVAAASAERIGTVGRGLPLVRKGGIDAGPRIRSSP
jgi:hypothetical protein